MTGTLIFKTVEFIIIIGVAVAGVFVGKALRDFMDKKNGQRKEANNE